MSAGEGKITPWCQEPEGFHQHVQGGPCVYGCGTLAPCACKQPSRAGFTHTTGMCFRRPGAERPTRKAIDAWLARIVVGTRMVCTRNDYIPKHVGHSGIVSKAGKSSIRLYAADGDKHGFWLSPPRNVADWVLIEGAEATYTITTGNGKHPSDGRFAVSWRIEEEQAVGTWTLWNDTDGIPADPRDFGSEAEALTAADEFRARFPHGYRTSRGETIPASDVALRVAKDA